MDNNTLYKKYESVVGETVSVNTLFDFFNTDQLVELLDHIIEELGE